MAHGKRAHDGRRRWRAVGECEESEEENARSATAATVIDATDAFCPASPLGSLLMAASSRRGAGPLPLVSFRFTPHRVRPRFLPSTAGPRRALGTQRAHARGHARHRTRACRESRARETSSCWRGRRWRLRGRGSAIRSKAVSARAGRVSETRRPLAAARRYPPLQTSSFLPSP